MGKITEPLLSGVKYLLGVLTILGGIASTFGPLIPLSGALGFIYATRTGLVLFGVLCILCGVALLYGKVRRSRRWTGIGLMAVYLCFLFAALLQFAAFATLSSWLPNAIAASISGALWVRWKFKTEYINKYHFVDDIAEIRRLERGK